MTDGSIYIVLFLLPLCVLPMLTIFFLIRKDIKSVIPYKTMLAENTWNKLNNNEVISGDGKYIISYNTYHESFLSYSFDLQEITYSQNIISNKKTIVKTTLPFFYKNDLLRKTWESVK